MATVIRGTPQLDPSFQIYFFLHFQASRIHPNSLPVKTKTFLCVAPRTHVEKVSSHHLAIQVPFWHYLGIWRGTPQLDLPTNNWAEKESAVWVAVLWRGCPRCSPQSPAPLPTVVTPLPSDHPISLLSTTMPHVPPALRGSTVTARQHSLQNWCTQKFPRTLCFDPCSEFTAHGCPKN